MTTVEPKLLSVVVPAHNEAERILPSLEKIRVYLTQHHPEHELVLVDDGSRDGTSDLVRGSFGDWPGLRLVCLPTNRGKGYATRTGILEARGDWILCSDADLSTPIEEIEKLLARAGEFPVVIGSRSIPGAHIARPQRWPRAVMGRVFNWVARSAVPGFADTQCGFKLYRSDAGRTIFGRLTVEGFAFDVEVLYLARRLGYAVGEAPVVWLNDERSTVSLVRDPVRMFADVLRIRLRHRSWPDRTGS